jgi:hypothetical protein
MKNEIPVSILQKTEQKPDVRIFCRVPGNSSLPKEEGEALHRIMGVAAHPYMLRVKSRLKYVVVYIGHHPRTY